MGKLTLDDLVAEHTAIKISEQKHGINIIGLFGPMVGGKEFEEGDLQILIDLQSQRSILDQAGFELDLQKIFEKRGKIIIHCPTEKGILKSINNHVMTKEQGKEILRTAKANPLDKLVKEYQEQNTSAVIALHFFALGQDSLDMEISKKDLSNQELPMKFRELLFKIIEVVTHDPSGKNIDTSIKLIDSILHRTEETSVADDSLLSPNPKIRA